MRTRGEGVGVEHVACALLVACTARQEPTRCDVVDSSAEDQAPVQVLAAWPAPGIRRSTWARPTRWTALEPVRGVIGDAAAHEGDDYINADASLGNVGVVAAAVGTVVYARRGCPQSTVFAPNQSLRECGAGWGNHVIIQHHDVHTRYAHLASIVVVAGDAVAMGQRIGIMGNSGRSDVRHLHFELGTRATAIDPCGAAQSFDAIYQSSNLTFVP